MSLLELARSVGTNWGEVLERAGDLEAIEGALAEDVGPIYPPRELVFNAFSFFPVEDTRVVIIGLDPYIRAGQAMGMSFSVTEGTKLPPSLKNIFKEIARDIGGDVRKRGDLTDWAEQGVLLLNTYLTVREGKTKSHAKIWKGFARRLLEELVARTERLVFLLWGNDAQGAVEGIPLGAGHIVLKSVHPSPLSASRGFHGCSHFSLCNQALIDLGMEPIQWS